jgi:predicted PilT family ATPase
MIFDFSQASMTISIPKEHHRFILGKSGVKLKDLEKNTATKITVPNVADTSDKITITGTKEGIEKAVHEIKVTSDEQVFLINFFCWKTELIYYGYVFTN